MRSLKDQPIGSDSRIDFNFVKTKLKEIALSYFHGYSLDSLPLNVSRAELLALRNLSKNKNIVILRPDKGNGVVILNKMDYINKVETLLLDVSKFRKLDTDVLDLCLKREGKLIRFLRDTLLKKQCISESVYRDLSPQGSKPGILYGLPKVHKENCPARPIMSAIGTYNYRLAKFLVPILQPLTVNQYTVHSSFSFVKEITSFKSDNKTVMASFDVSSLFTNIPLDETIAIITDTLFSETDTLKTADCSFTKIQFKKLLELAVKENHFIFSDQLYHQIDGVAMGSPLGPTLANIFMCALEQNFLTNCPSEFQPILYRRYVDDTYCIFENINQVESFLEYLNSQHPNIKFTHEVEENNSLAFLDVLVIHDGNGFATNVYRKKTFTGLYTNFESLSPSKYKVNLVTVLVYRAFHICSSYAHFHDHLCNIKRFLQQNCFPKHLIDKLIKKFLDGQYIPKIRPATVSNSR